jgi:small subunit ribosomal protein S18
MFKKRKNKKGGKFGKSKSSSQSNLNLLQKPGVKFFKQCPFSGKDAPIIDYKNIKVIRKYLSETGRILPSRITSVSQKKQRELSNAIKRARILALL